jgi:hypothetical protein
MRICIALLLVAGCGATNDPGLRAFVRIPGAQFVPGAMPSDTSGPAVSSANTTSTLVIVGRTTSVVGLVPRPTQAVALGRVGDPGYWIIQPGAPDLMLGDQLSFSARMQVSPDTPVGDLPLEFRAVSPDGHYGPPSLVHVTAATTSTPPPAGTLVVSLFWDSESDLDLHVVEPDGVEIWARKINSWTPPPPGVLPDPNAWKSGGILDFDSNSQCAIDGRRNENVYWQQTPPSGHYVARVDAYSLCGQIESNWSVSVKLNGQETQKVRGLARDADVVGAHEQGSGLLAVEFDVP